MKRNTSKHMVVTEIIRRLAKESPESLAEIIGAETQDVTTAAHAYDMLRRAMKIVMGSSGVRTRTLQSATLARLDRTMGEA